jgi:assimilatory nitrate reductase catalytic subunit
MWQLAAFVFVPTAQLDETRLALLDACNEILYVCATPVEDVVTGVWLEAAHSERPANEFIDTLDVLLTAPRSTVLRYDDPVSGSARRVWMRDDTLVGARFSGTSLPGTAVAWLKSLMLAQIPVRPLSKWLLAPVPPKAARTANSKTVCTCFSVHEDTIIQALHEATGDTTQRLAAAQAMLHCGTQCGSCLPELKRLARSCTTEIKT